MAIQELGLLNFLDLDNYTVKGSDLDLFQKYVNEASKQAILLQRTAGVLLGGKITHVAGLNFKLEKSAFLFDSGQVVVVDETPFSLPAADGVNPRIDRIEVRYKIVNGTLVANNKNEPRTLDKKHSLDISVLDGVPAGAPVARIKTAGAISIGLIPVAAGQVASSQAEVGQAMDTAFEQSGFYFGSSESRLRYNRDKKYVEISSDSGVTWFQVANVVNNKIVTTVLNNQVAAIAVSNVILDRAIGDDFELFCSIVRKTDSTYLKETGRLTCSYNEGTGLWEITPMFTGVDTGTSFSLSQIGATTKYQLNYQTDNLAGINYQSSLKISIVSL